MTKTPIFAATIDDVLEEFFAGYRPTATGELRARIDAVRADLFLHLDSEGERVLTDAQRDTFRMERRVTGEGAFARSMRPVDLYYCLDHYLDPAHAMLGLEQRQVQVDVIDALATQLRLRPGLVKKVSDCCEIELGLAMERARRELAGAAALEKYVAQSKS